MKTGLYSLLVSAFLLVVMAGCTEDQPEAPADVVAPVPTEVVMQRPEVVPDTDWSLHGLDMNEQRHSALEQINADTVDRLELTWSFDMYTRRGIEATPLMVDGILYVTGSWSMVYALDARTGVLKWFYDPQVDRAFLAKGCCDAVNRGVAYANGKVIVATYDGRLVALSAKDGSVAWDVQTTDRTQSYTITGAPRIAKNKVIIGNGGAELGVRGYISAYDIDSGEMAWRFYTVPGNPADGFENEAMAMAATTWTGEWWKWGGGGTVWDSMVYDPELDLFYVGVGNGSPWNQTMRSPQGGDNLFLASIVAIRPDTGEYVWHYQTTPGETWDFTATQHIMLADLVIDREVGLRVDGKDPEDVRIVALDLETSGPNAVFRDEQENTGIRIVVGVVPHTRIGQVAKLHPQAEFVEAFEGMDIARRPTGYSQQTSIHAECLAGIGRSTAVGGSVATVPEKHA